VQFGGSVFFSKSKSQLSQLQLSSISLDVGQLTLWSIVNFVMLAVYTSAGK